MGDGWICGWGKEKQYKGDPPLSGPEALQPHGHFPWSKPVLRNVRQGIDRSRSPPQARRATSPFQDDSEVKTGGVDVL